MGRRAKKAPIKTKKRPVLSKRFKCPFCANENTVECKMDVREGVGSLACRLCGASYQMPIHHLHEPIDVFSEWLDDCEAAQQQQGRRLTGSTGVDADLQQPPTGQNCGGGAGNNLNQSLRHTTTNNDERTRYNEEEDSDEDDDLGEASGLSESGKKQAHNSNNNSKQQQAFSLQKPSYSALGLDDSDSDDE